MPLIVDWVRSRPGARWTSWGAGTRGLNGLSYRKTNWKRWGVSPLTFSIWFCDRRGPFKPPKIFDSQPGQPPRRRIRSEVILTYEVLGMM